MARRKQPVRVGEPDPAHIVMPGVQPVSLGERLQFLAQLPMEPRRAQKPLVVNIKLSWVDWGSCQEK